MSSSTEAGDDAAPTGSAHLGADESATTVDASTATDATTADDAANDAASPSATDTAPDAHGCSLDAFQPSTVCFGDDASAYAKYLHPDAGAGPARCPAPTDFVAGSGEGACGYSACGPLPSSIVPADASANGATGCCFWVVVACGP